MTKSWRIANFFDIPPYIVTFNALEQFHLKLVWKTPLEQILPHLVVYVDDSFR
jgi:hypothetical protein